MSTPDYCTDPKHKIQSATSGGLLVCFDCGKPMPPLSPRATMDAAELKRELAMLRRQFNQRVDALEKLIDRHAS